MDKLAKIDTRTRKQGQAINGIKSILRQLMGKDGEIGRLKELSQMQACEGVAIAMDLTELKKELDDLKNDNRLFFGVIVTAWLTVAIMLGLLAYYG
jgi:hypothetical protein